MKTLRFSGVHLFVSVVVLVIVPCVRLFGQASAITSFTPTSGPVGTTVTVEMTQNPRSVTLVRSASVNGLRATLLNYGLLADGRITLQLTVPQGATTGPIRVVTFNSVLQADETATSAMPFTVTTGVTAAIRGFSPTSGPVGTVVTVTGIGFTGVTSANFQGQRIPVSVAADGMSATFTVPSGASGMAAFSLNLPNGQLAIAPMPFTVTTGVTAAIRGFSPTSGPVGTVVTVTGIGFTGVTSVNFQGQRIPVSVAADGMSATFTVPSGASGMAAFSLNLPNGQLAIAPMPFTVTTGVTAAIRGFSPTSGPVGTVVTVTGIGFTGVTSANFQGQRIPVSVAADGMSATFTVPSGASGMAAFSLNLPNGQLAIAPMPFTVTTGVTAAIRGFSPTSGPVGTVVTVTGIGFTGVTSANFQGQRIPVSVAADGMSATFTVPSGASGMAAFSLNLPNGQLAIAPMPFTVTTGVTAAIRGFSPTSGPVGTVVTVTGIGFTGVTSANFQGQRIPVSVAADGMSATFTVPSGASGMAAFSLNLPNGQLAIAPMPFTVTAPAAPATITGISPTSGSPGTLITITGTNFTGTLLVAIGGRASAFTVVSPTTITATIPTGIPAGPTPIIVRTPAGDVTSTITLLVTLSVRVAEEYSMKVSPQPTADAATLEYTLSAPSLVETSIVNTLGTTMLTLPKTQQSSGIQRTQLNVQSLPVGMYFVRVNIGGNIATLPLQVVR